MSRDTGREACHGRASIRGVRSGPGMERNDTPDDASVVLDGNYVGTIRKISRLRGYPVRPIRVGVKTGEIPIYQLPGSWRMVRLADVDAYFRSHRVSPTSHAEARVAEVLEREERPT